MTTNCTGLMGRIFGHKWQKEYMNYGSHYYICQRCAAVAGEKK